MDQSAAEQRAFAVAKLKRAASLPRMKDGRRPPMHLEAFSEGERTLDGDINDDENTPTPEDPTADVPHAATPPRDPTPEPEPEHHPEHSPDPDPDPDPHIALEHEPELEQEQEVQQEQGPELGQGPEHEADDENEPEHGQEPVHEVENEPELQPEPVARTKRRSRSRVRSRGSKDFKNKARNPQSPTPSPMISTNDSSPDDSPPPPPPVLLPGPALVSPIPSHFTHAQRSRLLISPVPNSPELSMFYPGSSPSTPMLPSLEVLQRGVFRSNSAAARMMAMHKLTGGTESYDHSFPSPSPTPPLADRLGRNNTVSGGERMAARRLMLMRLNERVIKETDGEQMSGGEEPTLSRTTKRRRRRSRRGSASANPDLEILPTTTGTPSVPPTPLPASEPVPAPPPQRIASATPSQSIPEPSQTVEEDTPPKPTPPVEPTLTRRRSVLVEEDDIPEVIPHSSQPAFPNLPTVPPRLQHNQAGSTRVPHSSDVPSTMSTDSASSTAVGVPIYLSGTGTPPRIDPFPSSAFTTPHKGNLSGDEDEEQVLYQAENHVPRLQYHDAYDRAISWVAEPVPVSRMPINDDDVEDDEEEDEEPPLSAVSSKGEFPPAGTYDDTSPRASSGSKDFAIEPEPSPEVIRAYVSPSPSSVAALSHAPMSDDSTSPQMYPTRLSVASRIQSERSPLGTDFGDWEESRAAVVAEPTSKRSAETNSTSTWEKVKSTFRGTSGNGRRSRSNSILTRDRREQTDSCISRESGASVASAKPDKGEQQSTSGLVHQQVPQPLMQSPAASASILSLSPLNTGRGAVSPVPPASSSDLAKYSNAKLFPFPGIKKLEEQRNRAKGLAVAVSTPEGIADGDSGGPASASSTTHMQLPEGQRIRRISHQASDSRLLDKSNAPQPLTAAPSTTSHVDYFNAHPSTPPHTTGSLNLKLPMNREGVKKWLSARIFSQNTTTTPTSSSSASATSSVESRQPNGNAKKRPSLSDLLRSGKESDLTADWEDIGNEKIRAPTTPSGTPFPAKRPMQADVTEGIRVLTTTTTITSTMAINTIAAEADTTDTEKTPKAKKTHAFVERNGESKDGHANVDPRPALFSAPGSSAPPTPDPMSSLDDYQPQSTPESSSASSQSLAQVARSQGAIMLERLDEMLVRGPRSPMWASVIDDPPRKLLLQSPVLQVVNSNTVKDRFLFLFTDMLVIAKPILQDHDNILESIKPNPLDRKFIVKSVVLLRKLHFSGEREEPQARSTASRNPLIRSFVRQFPKDADRAISTLFEKSGMRDDPVALGQLLFRALDLNRASLGDYLSRRTSKLVLKAFLDEFGFVGMPVDKALRVFLLSINISTSTHNYAMDYLLDAFAGRWYDANAGIVAWDKDLAIRLVRALVQLNEMMHGGISQEPGPSGYQRPSITTRIFVDLFRRYDTRGLISDDFLLSVYHSIQRERLCQAQNLSAASSPEINITIKRPIPPRLTYRIKSEPIVLRIPQADPQFSIQLYGQDLTFDPPVLTFAKSSEASFRVTGTSLGPKTMIMCRSGPNALLYASLPLSNSLVVERAFMRNTFQVAFSNAQGVKRRYMFSIDDPVIRHEWTVSLKRQIDAASASHAGLSIVMSSFRAAADDIAFKVLQEVLIGPEYITPKPPVSPIDKALQRLTSPRRDKRLSTEQRRGGMTTSRANGVGTMYHIRSKSRSEVYHRYGAGRMEPDATENEGEEEEEGVVEQSMRVEGKLWCGREVEVQCRQNSSIPLVLAYLQIGAPDHAL